MTRLAVQDLSRSTADGPEWFTRAIARTPEHRSVMVDTARVTFRSWGPATDDGILLIHGGAAHSGWWDHIAPLLAGDRRVVAIDLSGHGDSDHQAEYSLGRWAVEAEAVALEAGIHRPLVIGHSMGGFVGLALAACRPTFLSGLIAIESPISGGVFEAGTARKGPSSAPLRKYPTSQDAIKRFRVVPEQHVPNYLLRHLAEDSIRASADGDWTWKFDPGVFRVPIERDRYFLPVKCPMALFRCEHGLITADMATSMRTRLGSEVSVVELTAAGHTPFLDQPLATLAAIRALTAAWSSQVAPDVSPAGVPG